MLEAFYFHNSEYQRSHQLFQELDQKVNDLMMTPEDSVQIYVEYLRAEFQAQTDLVIIHSMMLEILRYCPHGSNHEIHHLLPEKLKLGVREIAKAKKLDPVEVVSFYQRLGDFSDETLRNRRELHLDKARLYREIIQAYEASNIYPLLMYVVGKYQQTLHLYRVQKPDQEGMFTKSQRVILDEATRLMRKWQIIANGCDP